MKAVLPAPLGPRSRKLLEGGEATAWKKTMWRKIGTPKVNRMAMAIATRLPSNSSVAMPVTECQFAWEDMVEEGKLQCSNVRKSGDLITYDSPTPNPEDPVLLLLSSSSSLLFFNCSENTS